MLGFALTCFGCIGQFKGWNMISLAWANLATTQKLLHVVIYLSIFLFESIILASTCLTHIVEKTVSMIYTTILLSIVANSKRDLRNNKLQ